MLGMEMIQLTEDLMWVDIRSSGRDLTPLEVIKDPQFWVLSGTFFLTGFVVIIMSSYYKTFGQNFISDDSYLSWIGSISSVGNAFGRIVWGYIFDKSSYKTCMLSISGIGSLLLITLPLCSSLPEGFYAIWIFAIYFMFSGNFAIVPATTNRAFGHTHAATNYAIAFLIYALSSLCVSGLCDLIRSLTQQWSWIFFLAAFAYLIGLILTINWKMKAINGKTL